MKRLIVGVSGADGAPLAVAFLREMQQVPDWETHLVWTQGAAQTLSQESALSVQELCALADISYSEQEIGAPIASGSFAAEGMIVIPCSMKTLAGIACGYAENLLLRAADVTIKEQRRLLLVPRETPLSPIHLENMLRLSRIGVQMLPPMMTFYHEPQTVEDMVLRFVHRAMSAFGIPAPSDFRWNGGRV